MEKRHFDRFCLLLLALAFVLAGVKMGSRHQVAGFATTAPAIAVKAPSLSAVSGTATSPGHLLHQRSPDGRFDFDAAFVSSAPGKAVHAASLVELRDGHLRAVWFSGSREGAGDVAIQTAVLDPTTQSWGPESTLFDRTRLQRGLWRYVKKLGNPVIARAADGSLSLWMVNVSLGGWAGSAISWSRSDDEGASWSSPRRLVTSPFLNISTLVKGGAFAFADGQTGLPVYHEFLTKFGEVLRLDADGRVVDKQRITGSRTDLQPVVLVRDALYAEAFLRSGQAESLARSSTDDGGKTWANTTGTAWPNPDSAVAGAVTASGDRWLALNPEPRDREILALLKAPASGSIDAATQMLVETSATPGQRLTVAAYEKLLGDELGRRGADAATVQADVASARRQLCGAEACSQEFSYPYLLRGHDGALHLVYTWHRTRIKYVRLDPSQALAAAPAKGQP